MMTYPEAIRYLESFVNYERIPAYTYKKSVKLKRIKGFLDIIGNPQDQLKFVHIAGTKGKGTTSIFGAYILGQAGYRVGLYTSPHLSDLRERIRILAKSKELRAKSKEFEGMISKRDFCDIVERLRPVIDNFNKRSKHGSLTFFEVYTALAFIYFKEKKVDFTVLETGLGGRLDATNVVDPLVCAITPISLEHFGLLGDTITKIAREKAGIIKNQRPKTKGQRLIVVSAPQRWQARRAIRDRCRRAHAKLYEVGKEIKFKIQNSKFRVKGVLAEYPNLKIKLLGRHQAVNAATAVGVVEALKNYGVSVTVETIRKGLYKALWPGRFEIVKKNPLIILDGAQNKASSIALRDAVKELFKKKIILILGLSSDKDIKGVLKVLTPFAKKLILTKSNNPRAMALEILRESAERIKKNINLSLTENVPQALETAFNCAHKKDLILVTGSLFVVGEARDIIMKS